MNWSKAKTILIIAFLVTNIILALVLFSQDNQKISTLEKDFIEEVVGILKEKDIHVSTDIPDQIPSLNTLTVQYEMLEAFDINSRFFHGDGIVERDTEDKIIISKENESVIIENNKELTYKDSRESMGYKSLSGDKAKDIAINFLQEAGYDTSVMTLWRIQTDEKINAYNLEFSMSYNERYIENTYTSVLVDKKGVLELKRLWLNPVSEGETPIYINTAPKALLYLIGEKQVYGKTIEQISLCYYFDPKKDEYIEDPEETKEGKSIPAWRIVFDDGTKIIIDNY